MARVVLDMSGNEDFGHVLAKLNTMLAELYAANSNSGTDPSYATVTTSGLATVDSLVVSTSATAATATTTGLGTFGSLKVDTGTKTATATAGAATLNKGAGVITSEALTTAAGAVYSCAITSSAVAAADQVFASVFNGTNSAGEPAIQSVTPGAGVITVRVKNTHATDAFNGTLKIAYAVCKN